MFRMQSGYRFNDPNTLTGEEKDAYDRLGDIEKAKLQREYKEYVIDSFEYPIRLFNLNWGIKRLDPLDSSPFYHSVISTLNTEFNTIRANYGQTVAGTARINELVKDFTISRRDIIQHGLLIESTIARYEKQVNSKKTPVAEKALLRKNLTKLIALRNEGNYDVNKIAFESIVKPAVEAEAVEEPEIKTFSQKVTHNCKNTILFYKNESTNPGYPANYRAFLKSFIPRFEAIDMDDEPLNISRKLDALIKEIKSVPVPDLEDNSESYASCVSTESIHEAPASKPVPRLPAEDPTNANNDDSPPQAERRRHNQQPAKSNYKKYILIVAGIIVLSAIIATIFVMTGGLAALAALPTAGVIASAAASTLALGKVGAIGIISLGLLIVTGLMTGIGALIRLCFKPAKKIEANDPAPSSDVTFHQFRARHPGRDVANRPKVRSENVSEKVLSQYESAETEARDIIPLMRRSR